MKRASELVQRKHARRSFVGDDDVDRVCWGHGFLEGHGQSLNRLAVCGAGVGERELTDTRSACLLWRAWIQ